MQTSQVTNPANIFSTSAPAKQAEANNANEAFSQVLSREVADRGNAAPAKEKDLPAAPKQQAGVKPSKSSEAKAPSDTKTGTRSNVKSGDNTKTADETEEPASQVSDDMLALVANLSQLNMSEAADTAKTTPEDASAVDPAQLLVAAGLVRAESTTAGAIPDVASGDIALAKSDVGMPSLAGTVDAGKFVSEAKTEDSQASVTATDFAAKGRELLNIVPQGAEGKEFMAQLKSSLTEAAAMSEPAAPAMQMIQPVAMQTIQTQAALAVHASEKLTPAVGTPAWDQALGQKVVWMVAGEQQSASLTLNPPDLGPLQVVLSVNNSQANATFIAAQPEVRQALEAAMPKLRDMLGEAGIQLGQATVNSGSPNQQGAQDQHGSQSRRGFNQGAAASDEAPKIGRVLPASSGNGLVDTFV
ncbi:flagellar hook-length control protein FliK [Noviherbaspirillum saxi]|uniref:Flagellar hook-length control protein FliK n=1 Tax=Noviherbaspirillum saxi TaxID=2320863 RepID=A0A3A3FVR1_9BURK|nr:flagellar hook-length control protein FliK [Noviherbaspirillum saxi]RJF98658.1 flagellar hook-length control protein FliK [Noviherbaspirillum saxi]